MAGLGRKVFTAGDVLTASDVQNYMMDQSVMYFAGTAARSSAIPTPSTGMTSYIGVTGTATIPQIETYTGSAWQTPYGLTQVANASFTSATSASLNNVFTTAFDNYRLIFSFSKASESSAPTMRFRTGGTDNSSANYWSAGRRVISWAGASTDEFFTGQTNAVITNTNTVSSSNRFLVMDIINPALAENTYYTLSSWYVDAGGSYGTFLYTGMHRASTVFDGISFNLVNAGTGVMKVYGYRNS